MKSVTPYILSNHQNSNYIKFFKNCFTNFFTAYLSTTYILCDYCTYIVNTSIGVKEEGYFRDWMKCIDCEVIKEFCNAHRK